MKKSLVIFLVLGIGSFFILNKFYNLNIVSRLIYKIVAYTSEFKLSTQQLQTIVNNQQEVIILDVRTQPEYLVSHIKNAVNVPLDKFNVNDYSDKTKKYIIYCSVGVRSNMATLRLRKKGFRAYNLVGGIFKWSYENKPIFNSGGELTKFVHGYNELWGTLLDGKSLRL